jgi:tetraacyldisaccharide 4'-kinase
MRFNGDFWYQSPPTFLSIFLMPFSWLFGAVAALRRWCYRSGVFKSYRFKQIVIVVGNITLGGTGKTPLVISLARQLSAAGMKPGIVSRGYGGHASGQPIYVQPGSDVKIVGDEAILLARMAPCPVFVGKDRVSAVKALIAQYPDCEIIICDDGLQHYRLQRDIEIAVVDSQRKFGNGLLLPAGPLREPVSRLDKVDFIVTNGEAMPDSFAMYLEPLSWVSVQDNVVRQAVDAFSGRSVNAIAAIGNPQRFFNVLTQLGCHLKATLSFQDHYQYTKQDMNFNDELPVLMTAKDAVKCESFADGRMWYLEVSASIQSAFWQQILTSINEIYFESGKLL